MTRITASLLALLAAAPAMAAPVKQSYTFSLSGFSNPDSPKSASPITTISGSFTVQFDPTLVYTDDTADLSNVVLNGFTPASPLGFTNDPVRHIAGIGGTGGVGGAFALGEPNDFLLSIDLTDAAAPRLATCAFPGVACGSATGNAAYVISGYRPDVGVFIASTAASSLSATGSGALPEPATWSAMLLGFGAIGGTLRRRAGSRPIRAA